MRRRTLIQWLLSLAAASPFGRLLVRAQGPALAADHRATLGALARVVLPAALVPGPSTSSGRPEPVEGRSLAAVVDGFVRWTRNYREGAEMGHGYGFTRLRSTTRPPADRYPAQLAALDRAARDRGASFAALAPDVQRALVERALAEAGVERLPARPDGRHVAADLMSFYFFSSEAADLCYRAAIGRDECRGLPGSEDPPPPLSSSPAPRQARGALSLSKDEPRAPQPEDALPWPFGNPEPRTPSPEI